MDFPLPKHCIDFFTLTLYCVTAIVCSAKSDDLAKCVHFCICLYRIQGFFRGI